MTEPLAHQIFDIAREIRGPNDKGRLMFNTLYDIGEQVAALTAERDSLREAHQELSRLARDVADYIRDTSWSMGPIRKLVEYIDNKDKDNEQSINNNT